MRGAPELLVEISNTADPNGLQLLTLGPGAPGSSPTPPAVPSISAPS